MLKIAFAGFRHGHIFGLYKMATNSDKLEVLGAFEENEEARLAAEKSNAVKFTYHSYDDMLNDANVDIIAIGDYYGARGQMAIKALQAGKHVIADKPLCTSLEELDEIEALSKKNGLSVGLMLDMREHKNVLAAKQVISELGEIYNIQFGGQHPLMYGARPSWYFEKGKHGGVINDIAIHGIDLITYLTGLEVDTIVGARCWNAFADQEPDFKDCGQFMLKLTNNAGVIADISYAVPNSIGFAFPHYWEFHIWGKNGVITFSAKTDGVKLYLESSNEAQEIPAVVSDVGYLDSFLSDINENSSQMPFTNSVIKSSRATLLIQKKADESLK